MKSLSTVKLSISVFIFFLVALTGCHLKYIPEPKPQDGSIWYPEGLRVSTHRRLGLAGKNILHVDTVLNHARHLGYGIHELPKVVGNGYNLRTMADRYNTFWLDYQIIVDDYGMIKSIVESRLADSDLGVYVNYVKFRNFVCVICPKIDLHHPVATSEYANTGPFNVVFPEGMENSIRFRLGLADVSSIHMDAVTSHAKALDYKVIETLHNVNAIKSKMVIIESGLSVSERYYQSFEIEVSEAGWIYSIVEKRTRS